MSDQKPINFKAKKAAAAPAAEEVKEVKTEQTAEATQEDWNAKIAAAKEEKAQQDKQDQDIAAAAERIAAKAAANAEPAPAAEENKTESTEEKKEEEDDSSFKSYWNKKVGEDPVTNPTEYVPTQEDLDRAAKCKESKENDASKVIATTLGTQNEIVKAFDTIKEFMSKYKNLTDEDIEANPEIKDNIRWLSDLNAIVENPLQTDQHQLLVQMIDAINRNGKHLVQLNKKLSISKATSNLGTAGQPKLLRGDAAMHVLNNRYRGVYRIQLHNSGFWIKVVPLKHVDIDAWMQEVDFEKKQLGRIIGGHFHLGLNVYLKEKLADLVKLTTVDSNLENWKEGNTLVDSISIHDYDTLCWAYSVMMHKDGISISTVCVNPNCRYHNKDQYMDLARLAYINPDVYTEEAMQYMIAGTAPGIIRTQKDIKNYKEKMLKNVRLIKFTDTDQYELKDPSLGEFIRTGMSTLGVLASKVKDGKLDNESEEVRRYAIYHLTKMLSPWVSKIIINDENGKVQGIIDDRAAITQSLETAMDDKFEVVKNIEDFITNSKVSFYSATSLKCPKCGHQPNLLVDNIYPLDVEYVLFCLSYLKLEQIGAAV